MDEFNELDLIDMLDELAEDPTTDEVHDEDPEGGDLLDILNRGLFA